jgi:hypothetical protein
MDNESPTGPAEPHYEVERDRALLVLLIAASEHALEAFQASNNIDDREFVDDLKRIIARSHAELENLGQPKLREAGT